MELEDECYDLEIKLKMWSFCLELHIIFEVFPLLSSKFMSKNYLNELQLEQASPAFALIHWGLNQNFF